VDRATTAGFSNKKVTDVLNQNWSTLREVPFRSFLSCIGRSFRTSEQERVRTVVLGSDHACTALIVDSVESLTRMLVASLSDDMYGKAISGVPEVVRTMADAIISIEGFVQTEGEGLDGKLGEVEVVVERLKSGLTELLSAFQLYLSDVGLGIGDLKKARHAAEKRRLISRETEQKQVTRDASATESTDVSQTQATKARVEQEQRDENRLNGTTRGGPHHGGGGQGQEKVPQPRSQSQSKARRDWNGRSNLNGTFFPPREMEKVQ